MTTPLSETIASVPELLAHALELEVESADRYDDLADNMEVHNNPDVAALFRTLADFGRRHVDEVRQLATGLELPSIPPWDFKWGCPQTPEAPCDEDMHYLMTTCQALEVAMHNELRGRDFYARVAASSPNEAVRRLASEMAEEESGHVAMLKSWQEKEACEVRIPPDDLDPPNMPE